VLVHCLAGKDRTGIVAGFLLALAGVPDDAIAEDYSVSESSLRLIFERPEEATCEPETILAVLAGMRARHGSVREYLLAAGATEAQLDRVRTRLRTSP
jgi:protein tyrosine/serine phosphatase